MIDTVTFDLWNTLISNTPKDQIKYKNRRLALLQLTLSDMGFEIQSDRLEKAHQQSFEIFKKTWDQEKEVSSREQIKIVLDCLKDKRLLKLEERQIVKLELAYISALLDDPPGLIDGTKETLHQVRNLNLKMCLICNTGRTPGKVVREIMKKLGILEYFQVLTFSNELGIRKPNSQIFLYTLEKSKSSASGSVHVGDDLETDIKGAKNAGMKAVFLNRGDQKLHDPLSAYIIKRLKDLPDLLMRTLK